MRRTHGKALSLEWPSGPEGLLLRTVDSQGHRIDTSEELAARVTALEEEIERLRGTSR